MKEKRRKVLFVCTANQQRSPTAERMYSDDSRFEVKSAGTEALFGREVTSRDLRWADLVVVMENHHRQKIRRRFPEESDESEFIVLGIPDVYQYMEIALQREIRERFEAALG
jgi:protein-tyrosine phosphatase